MFREHPFRAVGIVIAAALAIALVIFVAAPVPAVLARAAFPFADNLWSEQPLFWQLWSFAHGGPLYGDMHLSDSYDYGPLYLLSLSAIQRAFRLPLAIVPLRIISLVFTCASLIAMGAWTALVVRRDAPGARNRLRTIVAVAFALGLGFAVISRSITFGALHPDALLLPLAAAAFALSAYGRTSAHPRRNACVVLVLCVAALYAKQSAVAIFPILALGWYVERRVRLRFAFAAVVAYAAIALLVLALMPPAMRDWVSSPMWHPYQWYRFGDLIVVLTTYKPYLGGLFAVAALAIALEFKRSGRRAGFGETIVIAAALAAGLPAFFKRGGGWHDLTPTVYFFVPYAAALFGELAVPRGLPRFDVAWRAAVAATLAFTLAGLRAVGPPAPSQLVFARMSAARETVTSLVCSGDVTVSATIFPDLFTSCRHLHFNSVISWGEVLNAYVDRHPFWTALQDDPHTDIIAWPKSPLLGRPAAWVSRYRLVVSLPVFIGYGTGYYEDADLEIYKRLAGK